MKGFRTFIPPMLMLSVIGIAETGCDQESAVTQTVSEDTDEIQIEMQAIATLVDSNEYRNEVSFDEHVVLTYQAVKGRDPSAWELRIWNAIERDLNIPRSAVPALALRGESIETDWSSYRQFVKENKISMFKKTPLTEATVARLSSVTDGELMEQLKQEVAVNRSSTSEIETKSFALSSASNEAYNTYFGFLHAHTKYSDGKGTPSEAYAYARDIAGLDFFAVTDHGEMLDWWPWETEWKTIKKAADSANRPGEFVALWGFEWSNPLLGHVNVINTQDFTDAISDFRLGTLYNWIADRPAAFARFNHPGDFNSLGSEFYHMKLYPQTVSQIVGMETWNGKNSFDQYYYDGGWESDYSYIDEGNRGGWRLGALGAEDNHDKNWGTETSFATAVLATDLTRDAIVDAYTARRFYATEDRNLYLDLRCQGYPMGSQISTTDRTFEITGRDGSGDSFSEARLYRNGSLVRSIALSNNSFSTTVTDGYTGEAYYYVTVSQNDDTDGNGRNDEAISSPIWIR